MPGYLSTLQEDSYSGHRAKPYTSGTQTRLWRLSTGGDFDIDDFIGSGASVGDDVFPVGTGARTGYVVDVKLSQLSSNTVTEVITYNDGSAWDDTWSSTNAQSVEPTAAGYVNTDIRATQASATWWRYADPSVYINGGVYPWDTADVPDTFQCNLEQLTGYVCDIAGVPMTTPVAQEELVVTTNWESNSSATIYRSRWAGVRHTRNNAAWMGFPKGTLLFTGASTRSAGVDAMPVSDLRFVYDPYGWCRQRAVAAAGGVFSDEYLTGVISPVPSASACDEEDEAPQQLHAKYVYWVQLFQAMGDFDTLFTTSQKTLLSTMIT